MINILSLFNKIYLNSQKKKYLLLFLCFLVILFLFSFSSFSYATLFDSTPKLVSKLNDAFESIEKWLLTLSTPAAAVAVGVGVFMKKFSFGDTERMLVGRRLIRSCFVSYGMVVGIDLILKAITWFVTKK